jgi:hypothetical protein
MIFLRRVWRNRIIVFGMSLGIIKVAAEQNKRIFFRIICMPVRPSGRPQHKIPTVQLENTVGKLNLSAAPTNIKQPMVVGVNKFDIRTVFVRDLISLNKANKRHHVFKINLL